MNHKRLILVSLAFFQLISLLSQSVSFTYDASGNRITRTIVVQQQKSIHINSPSVNSKNSSVADVKGTGKTVSTITGESTENSKLNDQEEAMKEKALTEAGEITTVVYPNPNKGLLKIDITNMPLNAVTEMKLYDLSGMELTSKRNFDSSSELDISQFRDGIYILRIKINEKIFDWKVIKNHD
jgi:Secretion system C-terminal sorting domain